jgi:lipid-binding SYLF domain-containing protein
MGVGSEFLILIRTGGSRPRGPSREDRAALRGFPPWPATFSRIDTAPIKPHPLANRAILECGKQEDRWSFPLDLWEIACNWQGRAFGAFFKEINMRLAVSTVLLASAGALFGQTSVENRLEESASVFSEVMATPDKAIPQELLDKASCVVVVPGMKKGAFIVGAKYGKGFLSCRKKSGAGWTGPGAIRVEGGSFGFQIGGSETDVIMLVMNDSGVRHLMSSKFTVGGDASVAAGPVGRSADASTDAYMNAEILSYSRSRGIFAGIALNGATLRPDQEDNQSLYGRAIENKEIINKEVPPPKAAEKLIALFNKYSGRK